MLLDIKHRLFRLLRGTSMRELSNSDFLADSMYYALYISSPCVCPFVDISEQAELAPSILWVLSQTCNALDQTEVGWNYFNIWTINTPLVFLLRCWFPPVTPGFCYEEVHFSIRYNKWDAQLLSQLLPVFVGAPYLSHIQVFKTRAVKYCL